MAAAAHSPHILLIKPADGGDRRLFAALEEHAIAASWEESVLAAQRRLAAQRFDAVFVAPDPLAKARQRSFTRVNKSAASWIALRDDRALIDPGGGGTKRRVERRAKSFADQIVAALRMRHVLPPAEAAARSERKFTFGPFCLNDASREIMRRDGAAVSLTTAEFELLAALVRCPKIVLAREQLAQMTGIQGPGSTDRNIDVLICRLRRKIELDPREPRYIKTVREQGYLFAAPVEVTA